MRRRVRSWLPFVPLALAVAIVVLYLSFWQDHARLCPAGTGYVRELDGCVPVVRPWELERP